MRASSAAALLPIPYFVWRLPLLGCFCALLVCCFAFFNSHRRVCVCVWEGWAALRSLRGLRWSNNCTYTCTSFTSGGRRQATVSITQSVEMPSITVLSSIKVDHEPEAPKSNHIYKLQPVTHPLHLSSMRRLSL